MVRYAGWIALHAGVAGSADAMLIPSDVRRVADTIRERDARGRACSMGGVAEAGPMVVAEEPDKRTGHESRAVVLGHLLRAGSPTTCDRLLALRCGGTAVRALDEGHDGVMVALDPTTVKDVPLEDATRRIRNVPLDGDTMLTGRDLGISFGISFGD
jgi:6-phosphofructokinase